MVNLKNEENLDITLITEKVTRQDHIVSSILSAARKGRYGKFCAVLRG